MAPGSAESGAQSGRLAIIARAISGDAQAFAQLVQENQETLHNLALRFSGNARDADDICQEIWLRVHRGITSLSSPEAFPAWLWRIASRVCLDAEKRTRRAAIQPIDNLNLTASSDPADELITREEVGTAWQAMNALSPRQRLLLYLREVQGQDYKSIAAAVDMSVSAVAVNLLRSRRALASSFEKFIDSPSERCNQSRHVMAVLIDGEADAVARRSLAAHLDSCKTCQLAYRHGPPAPPKER